MRTEIIHARDHLSDHYRDYLEGYRAVRLIDEEGCLRGELVWRLATGHTVEITEMGLFAEEDRGIGLGTRLLEAAIQDMQTYFERLEFPLRRIYLFCETINEEGRAFYEARGFRAAAVLEDFYGDGDAVLYSRVLEQQE